MPFITITRLQPSAEGDKEFSYDVCLDYQVTYKGYRGCGPSWTSPGEPPEPPEFDFQATLEDGEEVILTDDEEAQAREAILSDLDW